MSAVSTHMWRRRSGNLGANLAVVLLCVFSFAPIYWMIKSSFESTKDLLDPTILPKNPTFNNYIELLTTTDFSRFFFNSAFSALGTMVLTVVAATLAGYGLARFPVPGLKTVARSILFSYMFPALAIAIPLFILFRGTGLTNSIPGMVLAHTGIALPFGTWLMWQAFQAVPGTYSEAAYSMGAGRIRTFLEVEVPLALPSIVTVAILAFQASWDDFTFAFILQTNEASYTMPVALNSFVHGDYVSWGLVTSIGLFIALPPMLIALLLQRYLVTGLGAGGLKG